MNSFKTSSRNIIQTTLVAIFGLGLLVLPVFAHADTLTRQLQLGMSGSDVSSLQAYLATDVTIYPQGLVTGYFGFLTKSAVSNFQTRNGIDSVGRVGPVTLVALNAKMSGGAVVMGTAPMISSVAVTLSNTSATLALNTNVFAKAVVYYSTSPLTTYESTNAVNVSGNTAMTDSGFRTSHNIVVSGLTANTTYYYLVYTTDQAGNVSVTWPSTFHTAN